jgi:hypothetical protein
MRDHARIRLDIWGDDDFRDLTSLSQWLYLNLVTSPSLTFCGVADWRPGRIAALTAELTGDDVERAAAELEAGWYLVIDRDSEEALIRSFIRHDGLMASPNMAKAMCKAFAGTASRVLRAVIVHELHRLHEEWEPVEGKADGWTVQAVRDVMRNRSMTAEEAFEILPLNPSGNPFANPSGNPSASGSGEGSGNPSVTPAPYSRLRPPSSQPSKVSLVREQRTALDSCEAANA